MNRVCLIFLVGMPAAGKTYWGEQIATAYDLAFVDLDTYISQQENASIPALFAQYGEHGFREREHKYLKKAIKDADGVTIVACGGGTPFFYDNMSIMKEAGRVVYLQAETRHLIHNLNDCADTRPLLKGKGDLATYLDDMLQKRRQAYEQAHYILQTKDISLTTFAEIISSCTDRP